MSNKTRVITARVDKEIAEKIDLISREKEVSRSEVVEKALKMYDRLSLLGVWNEVDAEAIVEEIVGMFYRGEIVGKDGKLEIKRGA